MRIWTGGGCAGPPGYGYGGWAWLIVEASGARGAAGGERHTAVGRMALRGMIEALAAAGDPTAPVELDCGDTNLARLAAEMGQRRGAGWRTADGEPMEDPDLWEKLAVAVAARPAAVRFLTEPGASEARAFVDAWTLFARDKVKAKGPFNSAIPKPNLQAVLAKHRESPK